MYKILLSIWFNYYKSKTGSNYIIDGKQGMHLKQLIKKIEVKVKERGLEVNEETLTASFHGFLNSITDTWILDNLDISLVNSKFNGLFAKAIKQNPFTAEKRMDDLIAKHNTKGTGWQ